MSVPAVSITPVNRHPCRLRYLMYHFPALLILFILSAGCLHSAAPVSALPENREYGTGNDGGIFLYQNIVNASFAGTVSSLPEDRTATALKDAMDFRNPVTRDYAVSVIPRLHGGPFSTAQVCDLWDEVHSRWTYVDDPSGGDYYSPASRTITLGFKGDCDDYAVLLASAVEAVGGSARIITAQNATAGHAYPEVFVGTTAVEYESAASYIRQRYHVKDIGYHITKGPEGTSYWLNLDWWSGYPGGKFFADDGFRTAYYPDGYWERVES